MDLFIVVRIHIQLQTIKRDALHTNRDILHVGTDFHVKTILVHAQIAGGFGQTYEARLHADLFVIPRMPSWHVL